MHSGVNCVAGLLRELIINLDIKNFRPFPMQLNQKAKFSQSPNLPNLECPKAMQISLLND